MLDLWVGMHNLIEEIANEIECEDLKSISESDEADSYLWVTYFQLEDDEGSVYIEEL